MKNYRILRICPSSPYQSIFGQFFTDHQLDRLDYDKALDALCKHGYVVPGSWSASMRSFGNESIDILPDFIPLQKKWAEEQGIAVSFITPGWETSLLLTQIETIKPDVIYFYAGGWNLLPEAIRKQLKSRFPFLKVITGLWGDPLSPTEDYSKFHGVDLLFCAYQHNVEAAQAQGVAAILNGNCFDPTILSLADKVPKAHDFIFAGSSGYGFPAHTNRYFAILELIQKADLKIWCYEPKISNKIILRDFIRDRLTNLLAHLPQSFLDELKRRFRNQNGLTTSLDALINRLLGSQYENRLLRLLEEASKKPQERYGSYKWDRSLKPIKKLFPANCFSNVFGLDYFKLIQSAKVAFNCHTSETPHAGNIRMFEVTGMGSCLISDNPNESKHLFKLDEEILTYSSPAECAEKVNYLLTHDAKREEMAAKGQARTLKDHTVMNRCRIIHESLQQFF